MGRPSGWVTAMTGRPAMRSPGRPDVNARDVQRQFWRRIAEGLSSEEAALVCGVSQPVGARWFRQGGGMPPLSLKPPSGRYLSLAEREEIALLKAQDKGVREIARLVRRDGSTISRELRRNAATRGGQPEYRASVAQWHAERRLRRTLSLRGRSRRSTCSIRPIRTQEILSGSMSGALQLGGTRSSR